jgi:hypothetical protein
MTRQPAAEKRFTVACPMPRLAPVSSKVRRGWLVCEFGIRDTFSRIHPRFRPRRTKCVAAELYTVM